MAWAGLLAVITWPLHERRRALKQLQIATPPPHWPEWKGEAVAGKRLAVTVSRRGWTSAAGAKPAV